jgi:hypothetical protein
MKIETIMSRAAPEPSEKLAAAPAESNVDRVLREALIGIEAQKTAAASGAAQPEGPVGELMKVAAEVRSVEAAAELKQAQLMGASFADGMMSRLDAYKEAAGEVEKRAAAEEAAQIALLEKYAKEDPKGFEADALSGYNAELERLAKEGQAVYDQTAQETAEMIQKVAAAHYLEGFERIAEALA